MALRSAEQGGHAVHLEVRGTEKWAVTRPQEGWQVPDTNQHHGTQPADSEPEAVLPGVRGWGNAWLRPSSCSPLATSSAFPPQAQLIHSWGRWEEWEMEPRASRRGQAHTKERPSPVGLLGLPAVGSPTSGLACPETHLRQRSCSGGAGSGQGHQAAPCSR